MKVFKKVCFIVFLCWTQLALSQTPTNPLDIEGREPDLELLQDSTYMETIQSIQDAVPGQSSSSIDNNPFNVSHIPLKKTELPQKKAKQSSSKGNTTVGLLNFLFWIMVGLLVYFAGIMFFFRDEIFNLVKPLFNLNFLKSLNRESDGGKKPLFLSLFLFFIFNLGILIYSIGSNAIVAYSGITLFTYIVLSILGLYLAKHLYLYFIRWVYPLQTPLSHYGFTVLLMNGVAGILLFPVNILLVIGPENWTSVFISLGVIILISLYLIRLIKGFLLSARQGSNNLIHFFLYLCGSEIAPIALVYGLITQGF